MIKRCRFTERASQPPLLLLWSSKSTAAKQKQAKAKAKTKAGEKRKAKAERKAEEQTGAKVFLEEPRSLNIYQSRPRTALLQAQV